jgi:hypothetical protein
VPALRASLLLLVLVLVVLDVSSTYMLLQRYPVDLEFNPILRQLVRAFGLRVLLVYAPVEYTLITLLLILQGRLLSKLNIEKTEKYLKITLIALYTIVLLNWVGVVVTYVW